VGRRAAEADSLNTRLRSADGGQRQEAPNAKGGRVWEGPDSVTIEQRPPRRPATREKPHAAQSEPRPPQFEPVAPNPPRRRPRRPLTDEDFPELSGQDAQHSASDGGERRKGGLFSWMAGRSRGPNDRGPENGPSTAQTASKREEPHISQNDPSFEPERNAAKSEGESGKKTAGPKINRGGGNGSANPEEPFDIPDFFKRPLN